MGLISYSFSLQGKSHRERDIVCQDSSAVFIKGGWRMALAADGVGSCRHSDIASKAAIEAACRFAETAFPVRVTEDDLLAFIRTMANYAANAVDRYVLKHEGNFEDYHTTLVIALYNGKDLYYANAGDSGIVVLDERGCYHILTEQQNTEYGEVITLAQRRFAVGKAPFGVSAVACMTDGLLEWCCPNSLNEHKFKVSVPRMELLIPQSIWFGNSEADDAAMAIHAQNAADKLNKLSERVLEEDSCDETYGELREGNLRDDLTAAVIVDTEALFEKIEWEPLPIKSPFESFIDEYKNLKLLYPTEAEKMLLNHIKSCNKNVSDENAEKFCIEIVSAANSSSSSMQSDNNSVEETSQQTEALNDTEKAEKEQSDNIIEANAVIENKTLRKSPLKGLLNGLRGKDDKN